MRKLKITVAILVVLFACQAVFATFVPVQKAGSDVTRPLAAACDALQNLAERTDDPVAFYQKIASGSDEEIARIAEKFSLNNGYRSATTEEDLALIFPRGVEKTDDVNAFRRAAIHLAVYTARNGNLHAKEAISEAEEFFNIVGYGFAARLVDGKKIEFRFVDIYSDSELQAIAAKLCETLSNAASFEIPRFGEIDIYIDGISEFGFKAFVSAAQGLMYSLIYG